MSVESQIKTIYDQFFMVPGELHHIIQFLPLFLSILSTKESEFPHNMFHVIFDPRVKAHQIIIIFIRTKYVHVSVRPMIQN